MTSIETDGGVIPTEFNLSQNYPNPFNPSTSIEFSIPQQSDVTLKIYNVIGKEVGTLVNEQMSSGAYTVNFDATNLASGIYFYQLKSSEFVRTKKLMILK